LGYVHIFYCEMSRILLFILGISFLMLLHTSMDEQ
jgi:hypothetical protein